MSPPKVSIIIPAYNSEKSLRSCLDSAVQQSMADIEIICVDDCSTDGTPDILSSLAGSDRRIRIIKHSTNMGEGAARNTGIDNAKGEYIFHLDADDTIPLDAIEKLYKEAHENDSDMVKGRYDLLHPDGQIQQQLWSAPEQKITNTNIDESSFLQQIPTSHCTYLYRRQLLDLHNIRYRTDLVVGLDLIALATALLHASTVTLIPDLVYYYHQSDTSVTRGHVTAKIAEDSIRSKKIIVDMLCTRGLYDVARIRLQKWKFIIDTFFQEMPANLSIDESRQVFSDFRSLISANNIVPWMTDTPHHYRYTLALIISGKDEEALSFLRKRDAFEGFSEPEELKKSLNFVAQQFPDDAGTLLELGRIARKEGRLENALDIFDKIIQQNPGNYDAQLQLAGTLIQLGKNTEAKDRLDTTLESLTEGLELNQQIKRAATLKEHLSKEELVKLRDKLNTLRMESKLVRDRLHVAQAELSAVYTSTSWRITNPLRIIMASIKRYI